MQLTPSFRQLLENFRGLFTAPSFRLFVLILTGWAFGQLPDREDDVSRAEHAVVEIIAGGLAQDRAAAPA